LRFFDLTGSLGDSRPPLALARQLSRETMRRRHVALFVS